MPEYLTPGDEDAFLDFPGKLARREGYVECPQCKGHGGWNLRINAYKLHQHEDTAENRHLHSHFRCSCSNCWGHGCVPPEQTCVHEWERGRSVGRCLTEWVCAKCAETRVVDSSD